MSKRKVAIIGSFPPPVCGAAKNNAIMYRSLIDLKVDVTKLDVAADGLPHRRTLRYHGQRLRRNLAVAAALLTRVAKGSTIYMVPDAGHGAWYSAAHMWAARRLGGRIVIHHRSCRYVDHYSLPIADLVKAAGNGAVHVFLAEGMASAFQARYGEVKMLVASNARFVIEEAQATPAARADGPMRLGHLSNLCRDKGFFEVADAFDAVAAVRDDIELHLAGPVLESEVAVRLEAMKRRYGSRLSHAGPVSGEAKLDFYRGIDLFLFPTQHSQEAAPNVVYEALAAGVPTLATDRGCIAEIIYEGMGEVISRDGDFPALVANYLATFDYGPEATLRRRAAIKLAIAKDCAKSVQQYLALFSMLAGRQVASDFAVAPEQTG